jgi:hypothetical protein
MLKVARERCGWEKMESATAEKGGEGGRSGRSGGVGLGLSVSFCVGLTQLNLLATTSRRKYFLLDDINLVLYHPYLTFRFT